MAKEDAKCHLFYCSTIFVKKCANGLETVTVFFTDNIAVAFFNTKSPKFLFFTIILLVVEINRKNNLDIR